MIYYNLRFSQVVMKEFNFTYLIWILDTRCNLNCKHCYVKSRNITNEISRERGIKIIEEAKEAGIKTIDLVGGEPLLFPYIKEYIQKSKELGMNISITSNLLLLNEEFIKIFKENDVYVYVSLDGSSEGIHEMMRGKNTFNKTIQNLGLLAKNDIPFSLIFSISSINYQDTKNMVKKAKELGAKELNVIPIIPVGNAYRQSLSISPEMLKNIVFEISEVAEKEKYPVNVWCSPYLKILELSEYVNIDECHIYDVVDLLPNGDIVICDVLNIPLVNIKEKPLSLALEEIKTHSLLIELNNRQNICQTCAISSECRAGCYARAILYKNSLQEKDPYCLITN